MVRAKKPGLRRPRATKVGASYLEVAQEDEESPPDRVFGEPHRAEAYWRTFFTGVGAGLLAFIVLLLLWAIGLPASPSPSKPLEDTQGAAALVDAWSSAESTQESLRSSKTESEDVKSQNEDADVADSEAEVAQVHQVAVEEKKPVDLTPPAGVPGAMAHSMGEVVSNPNEGHFTMFDVNNVMFSWVKGQASEHFVQDIFHKSLDGKCSKDMSPEEAWKKAVVLDIGANTGFFGLLALAHGCAVVFVEVQPECNALISRSIEVSGFNLDKVKMVKQPLGGQQQVGKTLNIQPWNHCEGRFPIVNKEKGVAGAYGADANNPVNAGVRKVPFLTVESMLQSVGLDKRLDALQLAKIDTEGNELQILEGFLPVLRRTPMANIVVEVTPMWWQHTGHTREEGSHVFEQLGDLGYVGRVMGGTQMHGGNAIRQHIRLYRGVQEDLWLRQE